MELLNGEEQKVVPEVIDIQKVEEMFVTLCKQQGVKHGSQKFYTFQHLYFSGAIIAWNNPIPRWGVNLISQRPIVDKF